MTPPSHHRGPVGITREGRKPGARSVGHTHRRAGQVLLQAGTRAELLA
jgi:hypothetical protein